MKKLTITLLACTMMCGGSLLPAAAQKKAEQTDMKYRRSSIYSLLINHSDQTFGEEIRNAFMEMPVPDKYNDHELSVKVVELSSKLKGAGSSDENEQVTQFLEKNQIASRLVAKWFNRDIFTGQCDMELIKERGLYNATKFDEILAERSVRSQALMMDAGEDLIGNTFVLVNDIRYIDKEKTAKAVGGFFRVLGALTGYDDLGNTLGSMAESIKGFRVKINTFLYRLEWNEETANLFYKEQYAAAPDVTKWQNFNNARGTYKLKYCQKVESSGNQTSFMGINEEAKDIMVRKACQRALDENIVDLQTKVPEFRTKSPIVTTEPITAYVGMKEGVTENSVFEVLEEIVDENGKHTYKSVATLKPEPGKIWDNRYMAVEEGAPNANLGATTFKKVSGKDIFPGMLIREK